MGSFPNYFIISSILKNLNIALLDVTSGEHLVYSSVDKLICKPETNGLIIDKQISFYL